VNSKLKLRSGISDLKTANGTEITSDEEKAEMFNKYFSSVYVTEDMVNMPDKLDIPASVPGECGLQPR